MKNNRSIIFCCNVKGNNVTAVAVPIILITGAISIVVVLVTAALMWECLHLEVMDHSRLEGLKRQGHLERVLCFGLFVCLSPGFPNNFK